ncbi:MAG: phosphatase PAP2 family protein [candidate division KSB1 bacterium]|nr:phosphatase PAP2 family protein [candidate division KSB1 bacterium]MDZ7275364.1 phosphatase PAP2 family protein [candidate division KSB1 bacterium]MDZ7286323.1 phosphatase PAP2 family protein [candidate division KSB1 bacterium]MDZ7296550.1 phosphatase PAP2 family protein [candidate division KSB1 bacterium]MDZ7308113.1 phosphatase PAP2 family protein [candidate division KSB1 bacterium]
MTLLTAVRRCWPGRYSGLHFRLMDILAIGYLALLAVLLPFFHHHVPNWPQDAAIHLILVVSFLEIIRTGEKHPRTRLLWFLRTFYPLVVMFYGYFEMNHMNRMFTGDYSATETLVQLDKLLFGVHPTIWVQQFYRPWLDELMNVFYVSYYLFLPLATLPLFLRGKFAETMAALAIVTLCYCANFVLFYAFPSLCPRMIDSLNALRTTEYSGYLFGPLTRHLQAQGAIAGGCFPSTHVSGAMAWALTTWRFNRRLSCLLLPLAFGVALATVYLGYHHAVDPLAGILLAFAAYAAGVAILRRRGEDPAQT